MKLSKIFLSETTRPRSVIFGIKHHLEVLYQSCSNYTPVSKLTLPRGSQFYIELYKENIKQLLLLSHTGMIPWWSPTKIVQMVLIGCISR